MFNVQNMVVENIVFSGFLTLSFIHNMNSAQELS